MSKKNGLFYCNTCNFNCTWKYDYMRHVNTQKHKLLSTPSTTNATHNCYCGKMYRHKSSLSKHKLQCKVLGLPVPQNGSNHNTSGDSSIQIPQTIIIDLLEQNQELRNIIIEEREHMKEERNQIINKLDRDKEYHKEFKNMIEHQNAKIEQLSSQATILNNNFNLNIFLNEKCKDAMSIIDFIESLQINTSNIEYTGKFGYVEGITKIFIDGLKQLDVYKRPIHCTDLKRETLYIKEQCWEKDNNDKSKFKKVLGKVVNKNIQQINKWQEENPKCNIINSKEYELHLHIMKQSLGGGPLDIINKNNNKIIRNIAKEVIIEKHNL